MPNANTPSQSQCQRSNPYSATLPEIQSIFNHNVNPRSNPINFNPLLPQLRHHDFPADVFCRTPTRWFDFIVLPCHYFYLIVDFCFGCRTQRRQRRSPWGQVRWLDLCSTQFSCLLLAPDTMLTRCSFVSADTDHRRVPSTASLLRTCRVASAGR